MQQFNFGLGRLFAAQILLFAFVGQVYKLSAQGIAGSASVTSNSARTGTSDELRGSELRVIAITPRHDGKSYEGRFMLINRGTEEIRVPSYLALYGSTIRATAVDGEFIEGGAWRAKTTCRDAIPLSVAVGVGACIEVRGYLPFNEAMGSRLTARIRIAGLASDPFLLDWEADRKEGKFELARMRHIEALRKILVKSGVREEFLQGDDFWRRFIESIEASVGRSPGFAPFRTKTIPLPEIVLGERIEYSINSDEVSDHQYRYSLDFILDPSRLENGWAKLPKFTLKWAKGSELAGGDARTRVAVRVGQLTAQNYSEIGFKLGLTYIPKKGDKSPTAQEFGDLPTNILGAVVRHCDPAPMKE